ncbi:MAG: tRNA-(ms[2]io[6]A)-hydroxylase [Cytophagales bacterium]|nr:tRNA-(ms[2]io[6]A)-hydroxylase [Cytophagales bacterium]
MQKRVAVGCESPPEWIEAVMADFDSFLKDHADCERKASSMAMSFVAKFPDRVEILPELIDMAVEEMEHFRDVYKIMEKRGLLLNHSISQDEHMNLLLKLLRSGREERFMDRLILSLVETRGAEGFKKVYEALGEDDLKKFYQGLWASESRHGEIFTEMALRYFPETEVCDRLDWMISEETKIFLSLPVKVA